jgi:thiol-disulfide isomerase/thioredoxin
MGVPGAGNAAPSAPAAPLAGRRESIVRDPSSDLARRDSPPVWIPSQVPAAPPAVRPDESSVAVAPLAVGQAPLATGPAPVPSCVLTGQTLYNFALNDLNGQPFEYRRDHRGRLTLIDFWGTWCIYCLHAIPHLNILQQKYGADGLEVIGIAYEDGSPAEQVQKVARVRDRLHVNYRLLLGSGRGRECPVRSQFGVTEWPTLVLLDDQGRIIWWSKGLGPQQIRELDLVIQKRLGTTR